MIKSKEYVARRDEIWERLWELIQETRHVYCFDCGKIVSPDNAVIMFDKSGIIIYCPRCSWAKVAIRTFWTRTFRGDR